MYLHAETLTVDDDEGSFVLHGWTTEGESLTVNIHGIDLDTFYDQVKGRIGPYLQEKNEARQAVAAGVTLKEYLEDEYRHEVQTGQHAPFLCSAEDVDESGGYDRSDPKHPDWHSVHADHYDEQC